MSAAEIAIVKAAIADWVDHGGVDAVQPGVLARLIASKTGLSFGAVAIAKYLKSHGWTRSHIAGENGSFYVRPLAPGQSTTLDGVS